MTTPDEALAPIVKRVTARLIPILLLMYVLAFLDRANIGFAKEQFQADTGISNAAYALGAGIFFLGYALFEVPSNLAMRRLGAKMWLARIMITWGIISALMAVAHSEWIFYLLRVLLGIAEAGFFPGVIFFLTYWVPTAFRGRVNGLFYFGAPLAFIFGGPLSGALLELDGLFGLRGWQLMFAVTGIVTVVVGFFAYFYLDNEPATAKWLSDAEKATLLAALRSEDAEKEHFSPRGALVALVNPKVLYFGLIYFTIQSSVYGVTFYLPTLIADLTGTKVGFTVGVLTAVPWICAMIAVVVLARIADRTGRRRWVASSALAGAGVGILLATVTGSPVFGLFALSLAAAGFTAVQPIFWTLPTGFLVGGAAAAGIALINSIGSLGGFIAPNLKNFADTTFGTGAGLVALSAIALAGAALLLASRRVSPAIELAEQPSTPVHHTGSAAK
jgi:MFS family permease